MSGDQRRLRHPLPETVDRLRAIRAARKPSLILRQRAGAGPLLREIVSSGDAGALRDLAGLALEERGDARGPFLDAIDALASPLLPGHALELDDWLRPRWSYTRNDDGWMRLDASEVAVLRTATPAAETGATLLLGLLSSHHSGFIREAAIAALQRVHTGAELPFLLVRANDWVPEVRVRALTALHERLTPERAPLLLPCLPLLRRVASAERHDHRDLVNAFEDPLLDPAVCGYLLSGLAHPDREMRRECFRLAFRSGSLDDATIRRAALADDDLVIRRSTFDHLGSLPAGAEREALLARARTDPAVRVRRVAWDHWAPRDGATADAVRTQFLFDPAKTLRDEAQRTWRDRAARPARELYRAAVVESGRVRLAVALLGLGETGTSDDAEIVRPYLSHPRARVRRAALRATHLLRGDAGTAACIHALFTDVASVAAEARRCMQADRESIDPDALWARTGGSDPEVRLRLLALFDVLGKWDRLPFLLRAVGDDDPRVREAAVERFPVWSGSFNRSATPLSTTRRELIRELLATHAAALAPELHRSLEFYVRTS